MRVVKSLLVAGLMMWAVFSLNVWAASSLNNIKTYPDSLRVFNPKEKKIQGKCFPTGKSYRYGGINYNKQPFNISCVVVKLFWPRVCSFPNKSFLNYLV